MELRTFVFNEIGEDRASEEAAFSIERGAQHILLDLNANKASRCAPNTLREAVIKKIMATLK